MSLLMRLNDHSANSYWVGLMGYSTTDMNKAFSDIASAGSTVVRTWYGIAFFSKTIYSQLYRGFNEVTSPNGIYYQSWSNGVPTINTGATGLANFGECSLVVPAAGKLNSSIDNVVAAAKANGIRLIVAL
jgi:mannan endo-1,4-beta-mannosidase